MSGLKYSLLDHFKYASSALGWLAGLALFAIGLANLDLPYAGVLLVLGVVVWWLGHGIRFTLTKEREIRENANTSIDQ